VSLGDTGVFFVHFVFLAAPIPAGRRRKAGKMPKAHLLNPQVELAGD
jgi:hypothetical protein